MGQEESRPVDASVPPRTLSARSLEAVAEHIKEGKCDRIVVLTGAGISTAAGIPDFRSPNTGLYHNLARLDLPYAEAVFDISYFRQNPEPFYVLAKELYPGKFFPTVSHAFIALLAEKGLLLRLFTQNIDCLERRAGVPADKIVEAHGSFATQRCIECKTEYPDELMKDHVFKGKVPRCQQSACDGLVKPDIVFFGEPLPKAFDHSAHQTVMADLVLILGTSLTVFPFAGLPDMAGESKPRVLFNMEQVGSLGSRADDVLELGPCDKGIRKLADLLGWRDELEELWKSVVGEEETRRQNRSQQEVEQEVEHEVHELADRIESSLKMEEAESGDTAEDKDANTTKALDRQEPELQEKEAGGEIINDSTTNELQHRTKEEKPEEDSKTTGAVDMEETPVAETGAAPAGADVAQMADEDKKKSSL
ncbi:hypothetical protein S7711_09714 [Stachybotrys chartarum IBT 7711]|uniref:NAD-dependent protein deacetylase n=1 Tax=Stachybotrys chartarum (strain CBS 109288 / IBT 7711) TaxID=1280523 RepID=A0A084AM33_STACB|nr:hypothetical protein S7711_09714 [Stachybotrys chartarum IBT 7711]KFA53929.1 hypothetical protein S40293_01740 [Stachybotrys chartarum IBT 40293]